MKAMKRYVVKVALLLAFAAVLLTMYRAHIERIASGQASLPLMQQFEQWLNDAGVDGGLLALPEVPLPKAQAPGSTDGEVIYRWQGADGQMNFSQIPPSDGIPYEEVSMPAVSNTFAPENMPYPRAAKKPPGSD